MSQAAQANFVGQQRVTGFRALSSDLETEFLRKSIHLLIAAVPMLAHVSLGATMALLAGGSLVYSFAEQRRAIGRPVAVISFVTRAAARQRDEGRIVLGPVTLAIGAMLALLLYPEPAATIAIYALAFGDGFSSIVGKAFGRIRIPFTGGKTVAGSLACFVVVFLIGYRASGKLAGSLVVAGAATLLEVLPTRDVDNIILPVGTGFLAAELLAA